MKIIKNGNGDHLTIALDGRLDTFTSKDLEAELRSSLNGISCLEFDFEKLPYITSAGLRVISVAQKIMNRQGRLIIRNMQPDVLDVFRMTGLSDIMEIL